MKRINRTKERLAKDAQEMAESLSKIGFEDLKKSLEMFQDYSAIPDCQHEFDTALLSDPPQFVCKLCGVVIVGSYLHSYDMELEIPADINFDKISITDGE